MNPSASVIFIVFAFIAGIGACLLFQKIKKKTAYDSEEFAAYSDEELIELREKTSDSIQFRFRKGYNAKRSVEYLKRIDVEIKWRVAHPEERGHLRLLEPKKDKLQEFDLVYEEILSSIDKPQVKRERGK